MKTKQIYDFINEIVEICNEKVTEAEKVKLPEHIVEYEKGRLYEACYIKENVERIIFGE